MKAVRVRVWVWVAVCVAVCVAALLGLVAALSGGGDGGDGGRTDAVTEEAGGSVPNSLTGDPSPSVMPTTAPTTIPTTTPITITTTTTTTTMTTTTTTTTMTTITAPPSTPPTTHTRVTTPFVPGSLATVPVGTVVPEPAVPIDEPAIDARAVTVSLTTREAVQGEARGLGQVAGPAVRMEITFTNGSSRPVSLDAVIVDVVYGADRTSASSMSGPRVVALSGTLAVGASRVGAFVFDVPVDQRDLVTITVVRSADAPPVMFEGAFPR